MSTPNDMRKFIGYMYGKKPDNVEKIVVEEKKDLSMRNMLGKMRKINEAQSNIATSIDIENEKRKMNDYFEGNNVTIEYNDIDVYPNGVFMSGTIDGQIQFTYKVTPDEQSSGVNLNYLNDFNSKDPENDEVVKKLETYYNDFYKYWRDQLFKQ